MSGRSPAAGKRWARIDPDLSVSSIEAAIGGWLNMQGSRDLPGLLAPLRANTAKTAPVVGLLADFGPLFAALAQVAPGGKLPPVKTSLALQALHKARPVFFEHGSIENLSDMWGGHLRTSFSKYREVAADLQAKRIAFSKAAASVSKSR